MRKKILMIGNTDGLPGVPVSIDSYYAFFTSLIGGNWCSEEIDILLNPTKRYLFNKIAEIEEADYDYVITIFLGHGAETDYGIILCINAQGELIALRHLMNLSQKQLLIVECCRAPVQIPFDLAFVKTGATMLSMSRNKIRRVYEDRIRDCPPQEVILFACDTGEIAKGSPDGGRYSTHLLRAVWTAICDSHSPFISVNRVHHKAASSMRVKPHILQHPQIQQSRCSTFRRLPLVVNPQIWGIYD